MQRRVKQGEHCHRLTHRLELVRDLVRNESAKGPTEQMIGTARPDRPYLVKIGARHFLDLGCRHLSRVEAARLKPIDRLTLA